MNHLSDLELAALVDARSTHPHLDPCPTCRARFASLRHLAENLTDTQATGPASADIDIIMDRIARASRRPRRAHRPLVWGLAAAAAIATIAAIAVVALPLRTGPPPETFAARGTASRSSERPRVAPFVHASPTSSRAPLTPDMAVERGFMLSFRAFAAASPSYLLIAGCDARGDLHWALPVWQDPSTDPHGLHLSPDVPLVDLPGALHPEAPAGPFAVLVFTSEAPLGVQAVERAVVSTATTPTFDRCDAAALSRALNVDVTATRFAVF